MCYSEEIEFLEFLESIERENKRRKKYPRLPKIEIASLRRRVAVYFSERAKADEAIKKKKHEVDRELTYDEFANIDYPITAMGQRLKEDLMFGSAGFEGGKSQVYSVATEYNKLVDEATGVIPPGYEEFLSRMKPLSRGERYHLIEDLHERGEINWMQKDDLIRLFIDYDKELQNQQNAKDNEVDMSDVKISPQYCPFRSSRDGCGQPVCMFEDEQKEEHPDGRVVDDEVDDEPDARYNEEPDAEYDDDSSDYNSYDDDTDDESGYSFSVNGRETDMDSAADIDIDFDGNSASYDFDYDPGD